MRTRFLSENLEGRDHREDLGVDGKIILGGILRKESGLDASGSRYGPLAGSCEHGTESSGSIQDEEFLD